MSRNRQGKCRRSFPAACVLLTAALLGLWNPSVRSADETLAEREARLAKMQPEEKEALLGKKQRFDKLDPKELKHVTDLHAAISQDPSGKQLEETIRRYNQWLTDLSSGQREAILSIKDPAKRIQRIKELMLKQEKDRFQQFVEEDLSKSDRDTIYSWLEEFVIKHEEEIRKHMSPQSLSQLNAAPDDIARRRALIRSWHFGRRRELPMPVPSKQDFDQLFNMLSEDAKQRVNAVAKSAQRDDRLLDLARATIFSRAIQHPSHEELRTFYAAMKSDDPRRERLQSLEREDLYRELERMYYQQRFGQRGGSGSGPGDGMRGGRGGRGEGGPPPPPGEFGDQRPPPPKGEGRGPEIQP